MYINCNKYEPKEIIRFMRDCTDKTQEKFAADLHHKRGWTAKLEAGTSCITLDDFLELAKINDIEIIMQKK